MPVSENAVRVARRRLGEISYRHPAHAELPHIVSFSGGKSSAALTFMAAEEGLLSPERGDAVLFANTSAEHPGTYEFAGRCKERLEAEFDLPVFWFEFCTVEDAWRGEYRRKLSYRLVKPVPLSEAEPDGYRSDGELFEELVSLQGMLPNPHSRTCTAKLKLFPSHLLLGEWLGGTDGPAHAGHHWLVDCECDVDGECTCDSDVSGVDDDQVLRGGGGLTRKRLARPDVVATRYRRSGGTASREAVLKRAAYLAGQEPARPPQRWEDFTQAPIHRVDPDGSARGLPVPMRGPSGAHHVRLLGLRADEPRRVDRVLSRALLAEGATSSYCTVRTQPPGERPYFPLFDSGFTEREVANYWRRKHRKGFALRIPKGAGNCVFCFMKGTKALSAMSRADDARRTAGTPTDIGWWADFEQRHARITPKRGGEGMSRFGFFGVNSISFAELADGADAPTDRYLKGTPACDCTD